MNKDQTSPMIDFYEDSAEVMCTIPSIGEVRSEAIIRLRKEDSWNLKSLSNATRLPEQFFLDLMENSVINFIPAHITYAESCLKILLKDRK